MNATSLTKRERSRVWMRFRQHRLAMVGGVILIILTSLAVLALWVSGQDPYKVDLKAYRNPPLGNISWGRIPPAVMSLAGYCMVPGYPCRWV